MEKLDYKKEYRDLYMPPKKPQTIQVPPINFIMVDGKGAPESSEYQNSISVLYALTFTIKMSKMGKVSIEGYFEYVVPPLEGLWWVDDEPFDFNKREQWKWTSMIRQPEFVTEEVYNWALEECKVKKPELNFEEVRFECFDEGLCVQMMHVGPYSTEPESFEMMAEYIEREGLVDECGTIRKHHEIYISDPRRVKPDKMKTVLRHPVKAKG